MVSRNSFCKSNIIHERFSRRSFAIRLLAAIDVHFSGNIWLAIPVLLETRVSFLNLHCSLSYPFLHRCWLSVAELQALPKHHEINRRAEVRFETNFVRKLYSPTLKAVLLVSFGLVSFFRVCLIEIEWCYKKNQGRWGNLKYQWIYIFLKNLWRNLRSYKYLLNIWN